MASSRETASTNRASGDPAPRRAVARGSRAPDYQAGRGGAARGTHTPVTVRRGLPRHDPTMPRPQVESTTSHSSTHVCDGMMDVPARGSHQLGSHQLAPSAGATRLPSSHGPHVVSASDRPPQHRARAPAEPLRGRRVMSCDEDQSKGHRPNTSHGPEREPHGHEVGVRSARPPRRPPWLRPQGSPAGEEPGHAQDNGRGPPSHPPPPPTGPSAIAASRAAATAPRAR